MGCKVCGWTVEANHPLSGASINPLFERGRRRGKRGISVRAELECVLFIFFFFFFLFSPSFFLPPIFFLMILTLGQPRHGNRDQKREDLWPQVCYR